MLIEGAPVIMLFYKEQNSKIALDTRIRFLFMFYEMRVHRRTITLSLTELQDPGASRKLDLRKTDHTQNIVLEVWPVKLK